MNTSYDLLVFSAVILPNFYDEQNLGRPFPHGKRTTPESCWHFGAGVPSEHRARSSVTSGNEWPMEFVGGVCFPLILFSRKKSFGNGKVKTPRLEMGK